MQRASKAGQTSRRKAVKALMASGAAWTVASGNLPAAPPEGKTNMTVTCVIRYQIDPYQRDDFKKYAEAWGLIAFDSLASYEAYRARLSTDPEARANFAMAQSKRLIVREERNFVEVVEGTFELPATLAGKR